MDKKTVTAIIVAAGNSTRFGQNKNKNLFEINGKPIIKYSIDVFNKSEKIDDIILVIKEEEKEYFEDIVKTIKLNKPFRYVIGGNSRKASVYNALKKTNSDIVIIHDGARPRIKEEYIDKCLIEMQNYKGATIGVKSKDTIKICNDDGIVLETTKRANTYLIQTPQCFDREVLIKLHEKYIDDEDITDDCMLLEKDSYDIKIVQGDYTNIKVTTFDDLKLITKTYWKNRQNIVK